MHDAKGAIPPQPEGAGLPGAVSVTTGSSSRSPQKEKPISQTVNYIIRNNLVSAASGQERS
jgi:hypothetical protein